MIDKLNESKFSRDTYRFLMNVFISVVAASAARVCLHFLFGCVVFGRLFALHSFVYSFLCRGHLSAILTSIKISKCIKT